ncbi:UV DNA damage repair endonuclease UvsE [Bacillus solimangrovi]|uniref:UV damage endonuclease UvsE n=1 Tax=Bacillus solimangrovi TaxID=1305675 RepID=A0A1E5LGQ7_9BACI|nr:UV DNA damage repair endonuclease UvsE [Bacillus solimangrovi]OEH93236.1 UV damage endonuclease UvsE [Bacillus solimangrovi]
MLVRFGYVSHALSLWEASPAKTVTFSNWKKLKKNERLDKLITVTKINLENTKRALYYNIAQGIPLYRFSSSIVPLATHPEVDFDYLSHFQTQFIEIGEIVQKHKLRVSFHPNQFTLFTSEKEQITANAITDMTYHFNVLEAMNLEKKSLINIHIGGAYGDKAKAIKQLHYNIKKLPEHIKQIMTFENDDKTYNASDVLHICEDLRIPMIFDYHHEQANPSEIPYQHLLNRIFKTWEWRNLTPKVHLSSPQSDENFRKHSDMVDEKFIDPFLKEARQIGTDFDTMIEAKNKDKALLHLMGKLAKQRGVKRLSGGVLLFP